jgi:hypothetical protein
MNHVIEKQPTTTKRPERPLLFVVWIDSNCGIEELGTDWEMNSAHLCPAKPPQDALDEAAECQAAGFPTKIMPEGQTPRDDGFFSNPATDPEA